MASRSAARRAGRKFKHKARATSSVGGLFAIGGAYLRTEHRQPLRDDDQRDLFIVTWAAFAAMTTGAPTEDDCHMLQYSMNAAMILAEMGFGEEHLDLFRRAQEGVFRAMVRGQSRNTWRFDGADIESVRIAIELHEQQCALATKAELKQVRDTIYERMAAGDVLTVQIQQ